MFPVFWGLNPLSLAFARQLPRKGELIVLLEKTAKSSPLVGAGKAARL